jgi:branched-chain amino acid transport system permease protein
LLLRGDASLLSTAGVAGCYAIVVLATQWIAGYGGLMALGQPAIFGVGAYVYAIAATRYLLPFAACVLLAVGAGCLVSVVLIPTLRLSGVYFALATFALVPLFQQVVLWAGGLTQGATGIIGIPGFPGASLVGPGRLVSYYMIWVPVLVVLLAGIALRRSRAGRAMLALNGSSDLAASLGIDVFRTKSFALVASGTVTALGGALYAAQGDFIDPTQFGFDLSLLFIAMLFVGGAVSPTGALAGCVLFEMVPSAFSTLEQYRVYVFSGLLVLILAVSPTGITGLPAGLRALRSRVPGRQLDRQ